MTHRTSLFLLAAGLLASCAGDLQSSTGGSAPTGNVSDASLDELRRHRDAGTDASTSTTTSDAGSTSTADASTSTPMPGVYRPFASTSPWNTKIPASPALHPDSTALINSLATSSPWGSLGINTRPWGIPCYTVDANTPLATVHTTTVAGQGFSTYTQVPIPANATPDPESDAHLCIVDKARGIEWGFWQAAGSGSSWTCSVCATADLNGSGVRPPQDGRQDWTLSHGARACGFPLMAGLITVEEMQAGRIDHALVIAYPGIRSRYYTPPASTAQATFGSLSQTWGIPCGGRIQLDPSIDVTTLGLSRSGQIIARALQEYGAYVGDYSGSINFYADGSDAARAVWGTGLLTGGELSSLDMHRLRVLAWGTLYDNNN